MNYIKFKNDEKNSNYEIYIKDKFCYYYNKLYIIPFQSWKIHISAFFDNYEIILEKTVRYCIKNNLSFKWIYYFKDFEYNLSKFESRISSGKFITIYPKNIEIFKKAVEDLYEILKDYKACDIITDRKYKNSIVQYRYGSNISNYIFGKNNEKIYDREFAYYFQPDFVEDPFGIKSKEFDRIILKNKYEILRVISVTNSTCVYIGEDLKNNKKVILKETRKYLGIDNENTYIKLRKREKDKIKLFDFNFFPKYIDDFEELDRYYLVMTYFEGQTLRERLERESLIYFDKYNKLKIRKFEENLIEIYLKCNVIVETINSSGYYLNDISLDNFIIDNNNEVKFIDLEFINTFKEMKNFDYNIKEDEVLNIEYKYIQNSDKVKLSYMFLKYITFYSSMKGSVETKINLMNNLFKNYNFSIKFIETIFGDIKKNNVNLYRKIFRDNIKYKDFLTEKNFYILKDLNYRNIEEKEDLNDYINNLYLFLKTKNIKKNVILRLYKKLLLLYDLEKLEFNYVKTALILLEFYKLLNLEKLNKKFYEVINKFSEYITEYNGYLMFNYINETKSVNFKHGNAGLLLINHEYKKIFKKELFDQSKFLEILKYNYTNKLSFDYGILGIIYSLEYIYKDHNNSKINELINEKKQIFNILINDDYYKKDLKFLEICDDKNNKYYIDIK